MKKEGKIFVDNDNEANQSCPPIMEEDITRSINEQQDNRIVKSQEFNRTALDDSELETEKGKHEIEQVHELERHEKSFSEQKIDVKTIHKKKGTDFDCEKVESIEMSCEEESYRSVSIHSKSKNKTENNEQIEQRQESEEKEEKDQELHATRKSKKEKPSSPRKLRLRNKLEEIKEDTLNVLIAGSEDMGKTMFIRCFKKREKKSEEEFIKQRTREIKYEMGMMDENLVNRRNSVYFIDLPGFKEEEKDKYLREIKQYAKTQWEHHRQRPEEDRRIHCCLYFMRGPRIKENDLYVMKELSLWFNLIPVIAKSDQYTKQEILEIKEEFLRRADEVGVQIYDIEEFYRLTLGTEGLSELIKSPFGRFPPFAVASSFEKESPESGDFVRKYPWGKVEIENKEHSDFEKLCKIISEDIRNQLVSKLVDIGSIEEEEKVENVEGVLGREVEEKVSTGWKAKLVVGSVVVALALAFLTRKTETVSTLFKE